MSHGMSYRDGDTCPVCGAVDGYLNRDVYRRLKAEEANGTLLADERVCLEEIVLWLLEDAHTGGETA